MQPTRQHRFRQSLTRAGARNARRRWAPALMALVLAVNGAAFSREAARMLLPADFATAAKRIPTDGFGGINRGNFTAGEWHGDFVRIESRFAVVDPLYAVNSGKSGFTLHGGGIDPPIGGECGFKERVVTVGVAVFDATKFAYVCELTDGSGPLGDLTLAEPRPETFKARVLARAERKGLARVGDIRVDIASVHKLDRSKLALQTPVGYLLSIGGQVVGAVELTDTNPTFLLRTDLDPAPRRATLVAALGLSVLRDPASSTLGD